MGLLPFLLVPILLPAAFLGSLFVPAIEDAVVKAAFTNLEGFPLILAGTAINVRHFTYCLGDFLGCIKDEIAQDMVMLYGWEGGVGQQVPWSISLQMNGKHEVPLHFSHAAYRGWSHDTKAGRPPANFVYGFKSDLPPGVMPDGEPDILLNFDTGTEEHSKRRTLLADMLPALAREQETPAQLVIPPGVDANVILNAGSGGIVGKLNDVLIGGALKRAVFDTVGYNVFLQLFGADISENLADHFKYDSIFAPGVIGFPILGYQGRQLAEIRGKITDKVKAGEIGKRFMAKAEERGMNGTKRMNEAIWIAMFAGYGGSSNLCYYAIKHILEDPAKFVPMFRKNPRAFMLEAARHHPPVGGMNPVAYRKEVRHELATGATLNMKPGDIAYLWSSGSNMDPAVFEDPHAFIPGRRNAEKVLSWNNELDNFAKCKTIAGCPEAPRGCPGTWLSLRIATDTVSHFVGPLEKAGLAGGATKPAVSVTPKKKTSKHADLSSAKTGEL